MQFKAMCTVKINIIKYLQAFDHFPDQVLSSLTKFRELKTPEEEILLSQYQSLLLPCVLSGIWPEPETKVNKLNNTSLADLKTDRILCQT